MNSVGLFGLLMILSLGLLACTSTGGNPFEVQGEIPFDGKLIYKQ